MVCVSGRYFLSPTSRLVRQASGRISSPAVRFCRSQGGQGTGERWNEQMYRQKRATLHSATGSAPGGPLPDAQQTGRPWLLAH